MFSFSLLQYFTGLECGHKFCMQCWSEYLTTKIMEEGMGQVNTVFPWRFILWGHEQLPCMFMVLLGAADVPPLSGEEEPRAPFRPQLGGSSL